MLNNSARQYRFVRPLSLVLLCLYSVALHAANTRVNAIALFDDANGPAYVQISGLTINGKTELRICDGIPKFNKTGYDGMFRTQLAGASSLERGTDGSLTLTINSKPTCVVPSSLKFDKNPALTPEEGAEQAVLQGLVVSSSTPGAGIPSFKPGVRLVFVAAPDEELAAYLSAERAHSIPSWQAYLARFGTSTHVPEAANALASIYEQSAESAFAEYRRSTAVRATDLTRLKQAQQQVDQAEKAVPGYPAARKLREQISKELHALLEFDRSRLQSFRRALAEHSLGYAELVAAKQHTDQLQDVNPQYAATVSLRSEIVSEWRKMDSNLQSAEGLMAAKRYDEALAVLGPYRTFASELPRIDAIVSGAYAFHFGRGQEFGKNQAWEQAAAEFRKALEVKNDSKEAAAGLKNAEQQLSSARNRQAAQQALASSNSYAEKGQLIEAYETLANLPDAQQSYVTDRLTALQKGYVAAAFRRAQKLQEIHLPIRGRADEQAIRQAYDLLDRASNLGGDQAMKLRLDLLSDKISSYYVEQARKYLEKPMASGIGIGWLYLAEAEHFKPNVEAVKEAMARYAPAYQLRSRLSLGVVLRDQTSRRDSLGFADQLRDALVGGLESSGLPVKALRQFNESDAVQPNFVLVTEILEHRVVKNTNVETLQSKYRAGTHDIKNPAWLEANRDYEGAQQQLSVAQRALSDAQVQHKKKEIVAAASDAFTSAQQRVADARHKLDTTEQTRPENVIETYNYTKKNIDMTAAVDLSFRISDQSGNLIQASAPIRKADHKTAVVLENVKPEDTEGVKKQSTEPDDIQFLTDVEIQARDTLVKSVREVIVLLPAKILAEARSRVGRGDMDGAAEEYVLYLNAVTPAASQERQEAAKFLHDHFNVSLGAVPPTTTESRLRSIQ